MSDNAFWASFWASCAAAIIGIAAAVAWTEVSSPKPSAQEICASKVYPSDFCAALITQKKATP
jgi:hypothetical protein